MKFLSIFFFTFFLLSLSSCSKAGNGSGSVANSPSATISDVSQQRSNTNATFHFSVTLSASSSSSISINYSTIEGTAKSGVDFKSASGTITIPANSLSASIDVEVIGDSTRKDNQTFTVQLANPVNCSIANTKATGTIVNENGSYFPVDNTGYTTPTTYPGLSLVWSDEFSGSAIDKTVWTMEQGNNNGWGNNELQNYTDRVQNAFVSKGNLIIEARQENYNGNNYTSARMITKNKKVFKFGRIDIRAKSPKGKGVWPALWMLGNNIDAVSWPACGEIDILELLGQEPNKIYGTLHWGPSTASHLSNGTNYVLPSGSFDQQFHVYSLVWQQDLIKIYVDDVLFYTATKSTIVGTNPFNSDFFFIFNVAVGGQWPGSPDNSTSFPQRMIVDYIRVFQ